MNKIIYISLLLGIVLSAYKVVVEQSYELHAVTKAEYRQFVNATGYVSDAERLGSSNYVLTPDSFRVYAGLTWSNEIFEENAPVVCVSVRDAEKYCQWAGVRLPTEQQYWKYAKKDTRPINPNTYITGSADQYSVQGFVWDVTRDGRRIGGSNLCNLHRCNGFEEMGKERQELDPTAANSNQGFATIQKKEKI